MGTLKSSLSSGLAKGQKAAEKQKRKGQQTAGGGNKSAAAYSAAPAKRHAEEPETVKSESTPVYTAAEKSSSANAAVASSMHYSSSGSKHGGSHGSFGEVSVYEQRRQQRDEARKDFWNHTLDLLGTASAQAGRGITGISVPVEQQLEESRRQIENVRAISEANARFEAARKPIEWVGRAELISALEQLDMQSGWEINEEQANAAEQQRQELLARLREGDLAAGNGVRSGTGADTGRDVVEGTAKGIAGAGVNLVSNLGQLLAKADAYSYSENEFLTDWMLGNDPNAMRQRKIDAYESDGAKAFWSSVDAVADKLGGDAAEAIQRAKEGKSFLGELGIDAAKSTLEMGFDAGLAALSGGSALVPMAARVYGQSVGQARQAGATLEKQAAYGLTSAGIEVLSEKLFDGVAKIYGVGLADDVVDKVIMHLSESKTGQGLLKTLAGAAGEGVEEVVSDLLAPLAERTYNPDVFKNGYFGALDPAETVYDFLLGVAVSFFGAGTSHAVSQVAEAGRALHAQDADGGEAYRENEQSYLNTMERLGYLPGESSEKAAPKGTAEAAGKTLFERVKDRLLGKVGREKARTIRDLSFGEQVAGIENELIARSEMPFATVRDTTPEILLQKAGAEQLPIIMSYEKAYRSSRSEGSLEGHYHSLGAELMGQIPQALEEPRALIRQKNGRIAAVLDLTDRDGKAVCAVIELSAIKDFEGEYVAYNLMVTAFGAKDSYLRNLRNNEDNTVLK